MISRILLALALVLAGCSTFNETELAQIRQRGLHPELLAKMESRRALDPQDVIDLRRAGVRDELVVKQLNDVGVNYLVTRQDAARLRKARVSARVIEAMLRASERFAARAAYDPYDDGWYYGSSWSPFFYSGWGIGVSHYGRGHDHRHGGHRHR
jgi:hypothetical protein